MRITVLALGTFAVGVSACSDAARQPFGPATQPGATAATAVVRAKPVPNSRAAFAYVTVAAGSQGGGFLIGDLRVADGTAAVVDSSVFNDGQCQVSAEIFVDGSGDATMDPTGGSTPSCGAARSLTVKFGSPLAAGSYTPQLDPVTGSFFTNVRDVQSLAVGEAGERRFRLLLRNFSGCDYLRYEDAAGLDGQHGTSDDVSFNGVTGLSIKVTRLDNGLGKRSWLAESQASPDGAHVGAHVAFCERAARKGAVYVGAYDIPFKVIVSEK